MIIQELYEIYRQSTGISTDTRTLETGNLFFALRGPNFNANKLAHEALKMGATAAIIDDEHFFEEGCVLVEDGLTALQKLARHHRDQFDIPFIGITGSNGKTTTKELIAAVLQTKYKTHFTKGNLNNHIGVPLTILSIEDNTEIAIIEMGANHIGEIEQLCHIANPDYGIITNIGKAHIEGFGSVEGVARAKSELYYHILKSGKTIFYNHDDEHLSRMAQRFGNPIAYPGVHDFVHCILKDSFPTVEIEFEHEHIKTQLIGGYNFYNICAAICIGKYFKVNAGQIKQGLEHYVPQNNRSQMKKAGSNTLILDAYNANPSSMQAAIRNFDDIQNERKVLILGDMFELGEIEREEHEFIGELIRECKFDQVIFVGKLMKYAFEKYPQGLYFETQEEVRTYLENNPVENSYILVKGSRGMKLEKVFG